MKYSIRVIRAILGLLRLLFLISDLNESDKRAVIPPRALRDVARVPFVEIPHAIKSTLKMAYWRHLAQVQLDVAHVFHLHSLFYLFYFITLLLYFIYSFIYFFL
jgi:hypothetical protein